MIDEKVIKKYFQDLLQTCKFPERDPLDYILEKGSRIGLDIGTSSIKIVEVEGTPQGPLVRSTAYREIPRSPEIKGSLPEETLIIQSLFELWQDYKTKTKNVRLVISDPAVYLRYLTIPQVDASELRKAIKWQVEKFVPFSIEEASVDYQFVGTDLKSESAQMGVIVVAVEKKIIEKYLNILKAVKVIPVIIDIAPFSVAKAVVNAYDLQPQQAAFIVDIGYKTTSLVVVKGQSLRMVRSIETAGDHVTKAIAEAMMLDKSSSEKLKREFVMPAAGQQGNETTHKIMVAVQTIWTEWAKEIERSLTYCERESLVENVDKIILCGGGAKLNGLDQFLKRQLGLPVEVADVLPKNGGLGFGQTQRADLPSPEWMASFGGTL